MKSGDRTPRLALTVVIVLLAGSGLAVWGTIRFFGGDSSRWTPDRMEESRARGDTIIAALQTFRADRGSFPATLDGLVPRYIPAIVQPSAGHRHWHYELEPDGSGFTLSFGVDEYNYPCRYYSSKSSKWVTDE